MSNAFDNSESGRLGNLNGRFELALNQTLDEQDKVENVIDPQRALLARTDFDVFFEEVFGLPMVEHTKKISQYLQWVERTDHARLALSLPPGHAKSELSSVAYPLWAYGRGYSGLGKIKQGAGVSYGLDIARGWSETIRDKIDGAVYQQIFPGVTLSTKASTIWHLNDQPKHMPTHIAVGIGGPYTGRRSDQVVIDDPFKNDEEARSPLIRERNWRWWTRTAQPRLRSHGKAIIVHTRWHQDDMIGRVIDGDDDDEWKVVNIPAIDEQGNALWPDMYPIEILEGIRKSIGPDAFEALYQGNPVPEEGSLWRRKWFDGSAYIGGTPHLVEVATGWDTALKDGERNDFTAWCRAGRDVNGDIWVLDIGHARFQFVSDDDDSDVGLVEAMFQGAGGDISELAVVEDKASGTSAVQTLNRKTSRKAIGVPADKNKEERARKVIPFVRSGHVHMPLNHRMYENFLGECINFPFGRYDDMMDAFVIICTYLEEQSRQAVRKPGSWSFHNG